MRRPSKKAAFAACALLSVLLMSCRTGDLPDASSDAYRATVTAFYKAVASVQAGEEVGARANFERVTDLAPAEPAAWANLGLLAIRRNDFEDAARHLDQANRLAPDDSHIEMLRGYLAAAQGQFARASDHYESAYSMDSSNVKAAYALVQELERQSTPETEQRAMSLLQELATTHTQNLALTIDAARLAVKRQDAQALAPLLDRLSEASADWPEDVREQLSDLREAVDQSDFRSASTRLAFVRNLLLRLPRYRADLAEIQTPVEQPGDFLTSFVRLPEPPRSPARADTTLQFVAESVHAGSATHAGLLYLSPDAPPSVWYIANGRLYVGEASIPFPGDAASLPPGAQPVVAQDFDYDYEIDLVLAGPGGLAILKGMGNGGFSDITSQSALPASVRAGRYRGAWVFDGDLEGDLDIVLARVGGPPVTLRNNGDGTFGVASYFDDVPEIHAFAWGDLDEDADPDAAFVDAAGTLHVFHNERGGAFRRVPDLASSARAIAIADLAGEGRFSLISARESGEIVDIRADRTVTRSASSPVRMLSADVDNSGALDLIVTHASGSWIHLAGTTGFEDGHTIELDYRILDVGDTDGDGRLDLLALSADGPVILRNTSSLPYRSQVLRPRSAQATGDQRINSFGIGGQIEVRSGLLFQKQLIAAPQVHFGLGDRETTDVARIIWPNGDIQAEFDLTANESVHTQQRLKGSCPWVFVFDGEQMTFVTDFIWRSPLGLAINAQEAAGVVLTSDRIKLPGSMVQPRDGVYDIRVTAELWETHFFDEISLFAVDHPEGTEVFVDERFSVPPPSLDPVLLTTLQPVAGVFDHHGRDVSERVGTLDQKYLGNFAKGRYQGVAEDHFIEIHLGETAPRSERTIIVAQGWVRPTDSSVNVAMSQGDNPPPSGIRMEAQSEDGTWHEVSGNLGFPAGKTKTLLFPVGDLLAAYHSGRIRLRTNLEIYWDAIRVAESLPSDELRITHLMPSRADLVYRGYSHIHVADSLSPEIPVYAPLRTSTRQWYDLEGYYTRFGDVKPLLASVDDRYVIMNAGDEIRLAFEELPPPPEGYVRDFFLQGDGWVKDGDFNTTHSRTVRPLPLHSDTAYDGPLLPLMQDPGYLVSPSDWQDYHTRYVAPDGFAQAVSPR